MNAHGIRTTFTVLALAVTVAAAWQAKPLPAPRVTTIRANFAADKESRGGILAADLNSDGRPELLLTAPGHIGAYAVNGKCLWHLETEIRVSAGSSENTGLPGHHAPAIQAADVDGDRRVEVLYLDENSTVHILDGATGRNKRAVHVPHPEGSERWEHLVVANLRGKGDRDLVLQTTNARGYRMGRYVSAYAIEMLANTPLWQTDRYVGCAHNGLRVADLDGDGRDEILGSTIITPAGQVKEVFTHHGHLDSIFFNDVQPNVPGLEVVALEEAGGNHVYCFSHDRLLWTTHHRNQEPQNAAVGEFDLHRPGLEIWCRSRYDTHQKPFTFDSEGLLISDYEMDQVAPPDWTPKGVEVIAPIHWTGDPVQLAAAKARHESGDVCLFEPVSGRFVLRIKEKADRLYVADVTGDWREEVIVVSGDSIRVYENPAKNPRPKALRLWSVPHYRRSKMTWNYYSP